MYDQTSGRKSATSARYDSMNSDGTTRDSPRMSVDAGSDDRQEPHFGRALYDFTAGGDEEVQRCPIWLLVRLVIINHESSEQAVTHGIMRLTALIRL